MAWTNIPTFTVGQVLTSSTMNAMRANANIGHLVCTSTNRPASPDTGSMIYESDTGYTRIYDGSLWRQASLAPTVTSLPASPVDGDEVVYTADATAGVRWRFKYRSASASSYKWEFVGGPPLFDTVEADQAVTPSVAYTWSNLTTVGPTLTLPLAGDYDCVFGARMWNNTNAGSPLMAISFGGASPTYTSEAMWPYNNGTGVAVAPGGAWQGSRFIRHAGSTAGQTAQAKYSSAGAGTQSNFQSRWLTAVPVRVG
jgi:hypothetical protein